MKVKTSALIGAALDWMVAQAELTREDYRDRGILVHRIGYGQPMPKYSTDWEHGGPIIERERINIVHLDETLPDAMAPHKACCGANIDGMYQSYGHTPLIAAMRCFVSSRLGDTVEIPDELA